MVSGKPGRTSSTIYVMFLLDSHNFQMCESLDKCGKLSTEGYIT